LCVQSKTGDCYQGCAKWDYVWLCVSFGDCSGDQTRWYRDAAGNFFVPIPSARAPDVDATDPMGR
jgi:hypothetical protein